MKKRIPALLLVLALLLTGCGGRETAPEPTATPLPVPSATPAPTPTPRPQFDYEEVLADTEAFRLTATDLSLDEAGDWVIRLRLENRADEILSFYLRYQSINGLATGESMEYRVAVGGTQEQEFRVLSGELAAWGMERPVQWSFRLLVYSAESLREPYFDGELSASPFGEEAAVRYEYIPTPHDIVVMDNEFATVYITGCQQDEGGLSVDYVAVSRCDAPLRLVLPERCVWLDGAAWPAQLADDFGARTTLIGYIPVPGWSGEALPEDVIFSLSLADPTDQDCPELKNGESIVRLSF